MQQKHVNYVFVVDSHSFWLVDVFRRCVLRITSSCFFMVDAAVRSEREPTYRSRRSSQHSNRSTESSLEDVNIAMEEDIHQISDYIAKMEVINPEVMRVTYAFCAFQNVAKALRVGDGNFYHKSFKSHKISTFWSHSWHGGRWKKILTLLTFYNAPAALFCGCLTAILMMILFCLQILPGFHRGYMGYLFSPWCLPSGFVVAILVMLLWRSHTKVFLDRLCISQDNPKLKTEAIVSLAGLLKNSDVMLILWDPTWTERLWCLFELAAFLKAKNAAVKHALVVRPIFLGPISIAMFLASFAIALTLTTAAFPDELLGIIFVVGPALLIGMVVAYPTVVTIRSYFRDLDIMKEQLLNISFDATRSTCCDKNHLRPDSGAPMLCDRKVLKECVKIWFGSEEAFEHAVRSEVLDILTMVLSEKVFTTTWILGATCPFLWAFLDLSATFSIHPYPSFWTHASFTLFMEGLILWLVAFPNFKDVLIMTCRFTRVKGNTLCIEAFKNLMVVFAGAFYFSILLALYVATRFLGDELGQALSWSFGLLCFSMFSRLASIAMKMIPKRFGW